MAGAHPADLIDLRLLRTFMAVAQDLSFTRTGARLFLTQQAVSSHVRALEASLGVQLFRRTTRNVTLTRAGALLQERMQPVLQAMDEAIIDAREADSLGGEILVIGHTASAGHQLLPRAAGVLDRLSPELQVRTEQHTELGLRAAVTEGRVHLGVGLELTFGGNRIAGQTLGHEPWCAVVGSQHPLAARDRVSTAELAGREWLSWPRSSHPGHWRAIQRLASAAAPAPVVTETWLSLAHARLTTADAVMFQPASYARHLPQGLVTLALEDAPSGRFSAVWSTLTTPPYLHQLLSALAEAARHPAASAGPGGGVPGQAPPRT
ncbi:MULTISPECIES: LysR family transcriptional regulator [unclassified Streptomyces]|uniref:LysR family transcriptional regulator n=1 Tax=unclassified Streptomyces TaxID=2593676 RepID=UPI00344E024C